MSSLWVVAARQPDDYISHQELAQMYSGDYDVPMTKVLPHMRRDYRAWERREPVEQPHARHREFGGPDQYIEHLKRDISENGMHEPIQIRGGNVVYEGHNRALAAMDLKMDQIPVRHMR